MVAMTTEKVSVQDDLSAYRIAYGEDRNIRGGDTVMQYVQSDSDENESED